MAQFAGVVFSLPTGRGGNPLPYYSAGSCSAVIGIERTPDPSTQRPSCREIGRMASSMIRTFGYRMVFSLADIPQDRDANTSIF
jgi:hypothetical protein